MADKRFVAIDGESFTNESGHHYVLLASSLGDYIFKEEGLSTVECFDFLLELRRKAKRYIFVAFGLNYDVNMMLKDVPIEKLETLWKEKAVRTHGFFIEWIPGKSFRISKGGTSVKIYDVFGFFQSSFVNALRKWGIEPQADMEAMKASRSSFDAAMTDEIIRYCVGECTQLVQLMDAMKQALEEVNLMPSSWMGAGSLAAALLRRERVTKYHVPDSEFPKEVTKAIYHSYFGGRVELFKQGHFRRLIDYDVISAYPFQALSLPNLKGGSWDYHSEYDPAQRFAIWRADWDIPNCKIAPFPYRRGTDIYYPSKGAGWYHAKEIRRAVKEYGGHIDILGGWVFTPADEATPFDWIREVYEYRAALKARGHAGEKVLKLGINAVYGKLAQGYGYRGKLPPYQNLFWAGYITSGVRARLFDIGSLAPAQLVMIATDGIFFEDPAPDVVEENCLGGWERSILNDVFVAQPGVYQATDEEGNTFGKSRGFFAREIDWDDLRSGMASVGPSYVGRYSSRRFVGLGSALSRSDMGDWRQWVEAERKLSLYPSRKFIASERAETSTHSPPRFENPAISDIYKPKGTGLPDEVLEYLQGMEQPLKEL